MLDPFIGLRFLGNRFHQPLIIILMIPPQPMTLWLRVRRVVRNPCLLCKDMHFTYLCPLMDEAYKLLEDIIVSHQWLPTGYHKLSLDISLVDKVVDLVLTSVDPTLSLKSEVELVDPTLHLKS